MRVLVPEPAFRSKEKTLAPRPAALHGKVVGFLDGWGHTLEDGTIEMYPLMAEIRGRLEQRFELSGVKWQKKPNIGRPVPEEMLNGFLEGVDVVVNGECI
jgi:hypothetical protein